MQVHSAIDTAWRLQTAIGLATDAAVRHGKFTPARDDMPGDLDHLAECLVAARPAFIAEQQPWPWLYVSTGLAHAQAGRLSEALECWRSAGPMLVSISGRYPETEYPELTLVGPPNR
jgi:hypothetical protein